MEHLYGPKTIDEAKATIQAEFDRISDDFSKSIRRCREAAEFLMNEPERQYNGTKKLKLKPGCSDL
jgi:hypothetical protein